MWEMGMQCMRWECVREAERAAEEIQEAGGVEEMEGDDGDGDVGGGGDGGGGCGGGGA